jgi:hypothetical protein
MSAPATPGARRAATWLLVVFAPLGVAAAVTACSGSGDEAATSVDAGGKEDSSVPTGAGDVVVNELSAVGSSEWVEIGNKGAAPFDLGGYALADSDKSTGAPKTGDMMTFPIGTVIPASGRLLVLTSKKDAPVGPHAKAECLANGPDTCLYASWGISASNGEAVHLLAKDGTVVTSTAYPRNLGIDADAGQTACRLPDLTGELTTCTGTPGAVNAAP